MISCDDCVTLSDDDNTVQAPEVLTKIKSRNEKYDKQHTNAIETIVIDEETSHHGNHIENNNIIVLPDSQESKEDKAILNLDKIYKDDELFSDFIEKCLDLENSDGMIRIVNRTVIKTYEESDIKYRKSPGFRRVLLKAIVRLDTDPDHKFSHVKDLVETLKLHKAKKPKKRVQLTTLATNIKDNFAKRKRHLPRRRINSIIIDSDDDQTNIPTINLDDYPNEVIDIDDKISDEEKENHVIENGNIANSQDNFLVPQIEVPWEANPNTHGSEISNCVMDMPVDNGQSPLFDTERIKKIELSIACLKVRITQLEETEVNDDDETSPYVLCEHYKAEVVRQYKELCKLTGNQPVKRRKVRLRVLEGHPPGPVRRLQTFINENIGEDGTPMFPDFSEVVQCVVVANLEDNLGWNKQQVLKEANSLFTQCGRALQKKRQKREYRDLLARVKTERPEYDLAEKDPELMRRLEQNRKIAIKKENDLLEKYVNLQYLPQNKSGQISTIDSTSQYNSGHITAIGCTLQNDNDQILTIDSTSQNDSDQTLTIDCTSQNDSDQILRIDCTSQNNNIDQIQANVDDNNLSPTFSEIISDEDSNFEPPEVRLSQENEKTVLGTDNKDSEVKLKREPIDVVQLLESLGDNYTTSVIDIEDPHLIIEISSDESSDEEMHVDGETDEEFHVDGESD